jgi:hypothetical protein
VVSDSVLIMVSALGETATLALMVRRGILRTFPVFCAYIAWTLLSDLAGLYLLRHAVDADAFQRFYLVEMTIDSILQFAVLVELAWSVLRPVRTTLPRGSLLVIILLLAIAGAIIWPLAGVAMPHNFTPESERIFQLQETFTMLRVVFFLVMTGFSQILSIGWHDRELQIATGLGVYSIATLLVTVLHSHQFTGDKYHWMDQAVSISYLGTLSYWIYSFLAKEQERKEFSPQMLRFLLLMGAGARVGRVALTNGPPLDRLGKKD